MPILESRFNPPLTFTLESPEVDESLSNVIEDALSKEITTTRCLPVGDHDITPSTLLKARYTAKVSTDGTAVMVTAMKNGVGKIMSENPSIPPVNVDISTLNEENQTQILARVDELTHTLYIYSYIYWVQSTELDCS